jgi:hypothetical protein
MEYVGIFIEGKITRPNFWSDKCFNFTKTFCFDNFTTSIWAFLFWLGPRALARGFNLWIKMSKYQRVKLSKSKAFKWKLGNLFYKKMF